MRPLSLFVVLLLLLLLLKLFGLVIDLGSPPATADRNILFPAPDGPMIPHKRPGGTLPEHGFNKMYGFLVLS
jgi:hypothetical protein